MFQSGIVRFFRLPNALALQMTFQRKVLLALVVLTLSLLAIFIGLSRWGLQRSLGDYVAEVELSRMDWLALKLERAYAEHGNWQFLEGDDGAWFRFQFEGSQSAERASPVIWQEPPSPPNGDWRAGPDQGRGPGPGGGARWGFRHHPGLIMALRAGWGRQTQCFVAPDLWPPTEVPELQVVLRRCPLQPGGR